MTTRVTLAELKGTPVARWKQFVPTWLVPCAKPGCWRRSLRLLAWCPKHAHYASVPCNDCSWMQVYDDWGRLMSQGPVELCPAHRPSEDVNPS